MATKKKSDKAATIKRCITFKCLNQSDQGKFVGDLCYPCYEFVTKGYGDYSQIFANAINLVTMKLLNKLH